MVKCQKVEEEFCASGNRFASDGTNGCTFFLICQMALSLGLHIKIH